MPRFPAALLVLLVLLVVAAPAAARRVELGAALSTGGFQGSDRRFHDTLRHFDALTPENTLKWKATEYEDDHFTFFNADPMVAWAAAHGKRVHGHNLVWCWDRGLPPWVAQRAWTRAQLLAELEEHIRVVAGRYRGRIASWDVVNEAFAEDGTLKDCLWSRVIGPDWVEQAFRFARAADPAASLFYNDYGAGTDNAKFRAIERMAASFRARGVPLDGVGLQTHLRTGAPSQAELEAPMRRLAALGLLVHVSELDTMMAALPGTPEQRLAAQATAYATVAAACHAQPACVRVTTWGFTDRYSWRAPEELPLPFDVEYRPKPAWAALQAVLRAPPGSIPPPRTALGAPADATAPRPVLVRSPAPRRRLEVLPRGAGRATRAGRTRRVRRRRGRAGRRAWTRAVRGASSRWWRSSAAASPR